MKALIYRLAILVFVSVIALSCKKGQSEIVIDLNLFDKSLNQSLTGATVSVEKVNINGTSAVFYTGTSDNTGHAIIKTNRDQFDKLIVRISKNGYFSEEKILTFSDLSVEETNNRTYELSAIGVVRIQLVNNPSILGDNITITKSQGNFTCDICCTNQSTNYNHTGTLELFCPTFGNAQFSYSYLIQETNQFGSQSVVAAAFDTVTIYQEY